MTQKETRDLVAEYVRYGFRIEHSKHIKIYDGSCLVTVISNSRCGGRADQNAKAALKRAIRQRQAVAA